MPAGSCEEHATSMLAAGCLRGLRIVLRSLRWGVPAGPAGVDSRTNPSRGGIIVRGKVYKLVVLHGALSCIILSFWPSGLGPAREEYGAPLTE
jgi:hypothetical protein